MQKSDTRTQIQESIQEIADLFINGFIEQVEDRCQKLLVLDPNNSDAQNFLGKVEERRGNLERARDIYMKAHQANIQHLGLIASLAIVSDKLGDYSFAIQCWEQLSKLNPNSADVWKAFSAAWARIGLWKDAESAIRKALELAPKRAVLHANLGFILRERGQYKAATSALDASLDIDNNDADTRFELAATYLKLHAREDALHTAKSALKMDPSHIGALCLLLEHDTIEDFNDEMATAEELALSPLIETAQKTALLIALGKAWATIGDMNQAVQCFGDANASMADDAAMAAMQSLQSSTDSMMQASNTSDKRGKHLVFMVGAANTGSAWLTDIASTHPSIFNMGQSHLLEHCLASFAQRKETDNIAHALQAATDNDLAWIAEQYMASVERMYGNQPLYLNINSMSNTLYMQAISRIFPQAQFIHCAQAQHDGSLALLAQSSFPVPSMEHLPDYYQQCERCVETWLKQSSNPHFSTSTDALQKNTEAEIWKLLDQCGLSWSKELDSLPLFSLKPHQQWEHVQAALPASWKEITC